MLSDGTTLLFVSHAIDPVKKLCKKAVWLDHGQVQEIGPSEAVCDHYVAYMESGSSVFISRHGRNWKACPVFS